MSYRNLTEFELVNPLTDAELKSYDEYQHRHANDGHLQTKKEEIIRDRGSISANLFRRVFASDKFKQSFEECQRKIIKLEDERLNYELTPWEEKSRLGLHDRIQWHQNLAEFRYRVERAAFDTFNVSHLVQMSRGYSLPTMLEQYDNVKLLCSTDDLLHFARKWQRYAQDMLLQLEQEDSALWLSLDPNEQLNELRRVILGAILGKLFTSFLEHVAKDLTESPPAANEESAVAQQAEHDQPEGASGAGDETTPKAEAISTQASEKPIEAPDPRDASEELEIYLSEFSTAECDELAEAVGLNPPAPTQRKNRVLAYCSKRGAKTKIYAIADVLNDPEFDRIRPSQKTEFIKALGRRLGFPSEKPERNASSPSYETAKEQARKRLKVLIEKGNKRK